MDERFDAQAELQNSHIDRSSLIPPGHLKPLIDFMVNSYEDQALAKSASTVVPFPSKNAGKKGVQSVVVDDLNYAITGEYVERPGAMNFSVLRGMVEKTPVLSAVVMTRVRQVQAFCKVQESGFGPGFVIRHADKAHKLTDEERKTPNVKEMFKSCCSGFSSTPVGSSTLASVSGWAASLCASSLRCRCATRWPWIRRPSRRK